MYIGIYIYTHNTLYKWYIIYLYIYIYIYIHIYILHNRYIYLYISISIYIYIYICVYICIYMYIYIYCTLFAFAAFVGRLAWANFGVTLTWICTYVAIAQLMRAHVSGTSVFPHSTEFLFFVFHVLKHVISRSWVTRIGRFTTMHAYVPPGTREILPQTQHCLYSSESTLSHHRKFTISKWKSRRCCRASWEGGNWILWWRCIDGSIQGPQTW